MVKLKLFMVCIEKKKMGAFLKNQATWIIGNKNVSQLYEELRTDVADGESKLCICKGAVSNQEDL